MYPFNPLVPVSPSLCVSHHSVADVTWPRAFLFSPSCATLSDLCSLLERVR